MKENNNRNPITRSNAPQAIAIPGFHEFMETAIVNWFGRNGLGKVLDVGAGHGAFSKRLLDLGYHVSACDLHADLFQVPDVEFKPANAAESIPWPDETFDLVIGLEITEHIDGVMAFFREVHRVLKPGGKFLFSTPNILSLKSRIQFLLSGYFYAFKPLPESSASEVVDHITPLPLDLYAYRLRQCGLAIVDVITDKRQRSSMTGLLFYPLIQAYIFLKYGHNSQVKKQNSLNSLLGRKLIVLAQK